MNLLNSKILPVAVIALGVLTLAGTNSATAATRLEQAVAAAAGRAAGTAASRAVSRAVMNGEARFRGPACRSGANAMKLRGLKHAIFMMECRKIL
jgi:hypothetical protein